MTEDQKAMGVVLEVLSASRRVPRTRDWINDELRLAGRRTDAASLLDEMQKRGLVFWDEDSLGVRRWLLTPEGLKALE